MQRLDDRTIYSASDLVGFVACEHLTELDRGVVAGLVARPLRRDDDLDLLAERGLRHERRYLDELRRGDIEVTDLSAQFGEPIALAAEHTLAAMRRGDAVIYQAALFDGRWQGRADFLVRVETPSALGAWSYEVHDTKLAREVKAKAVLQLCLYCDLLGAAQGQRPARLHIALGGSARAVARHRVVDYEAYYRLVKRRFEERVAAGDPVYPPATRPEPVGHCEVCRWEGVCRAELRRADDLSLVAGIASRQRRGLRERAVATRTGLAELPLPAPWPIDGASPESLARVREQARLQVEGERQGRVLYELLEPTRRRLTALGREDGPFADAGDGFEPGIGLLALPAPSPGDLFFDMEGDPFAFDDGFDYLFGVIEPGLLDADGRPTFHRFWSRDAQGAMSLAGEKLAFERVVDLFIDRLSRDPNLHIYHYAPYEPTAMGRLMGRHATRENEIDRLLRGDVFVDLYRAVRQGLRASVESYSIKRLEPLYAFERTVGLRDAGSSIVEFANWLQAGGDDGGDPEVLASIAGYNGDDCRSNWRLRDWLEQRRTELGARLGVALQRPAPATGSPSEKLSEQLAQTRRVEESLSAGLPEDADAWNPSERARWLLAQLVSWHRREDKAGWWRQFHLLDDLTDEERVEEPEPLGGLTFVGEVAAAIRGTVHRYRFPPQEHEIGIRTRVEDPVTKKSPGTVVALDALGGTLDLRRTGTSLPGHPTALVPELVYDAKAQRESLLRIANWVAESGIEGPGRYRAGRELLQRLPPRVGQQPGEGLAGIFPPAQAASHLALRLDGSCLAIQGPPGSGKSTTAAAMIVDLVRAGKRIGVTANSHRVIGNLLDKVAEAAAQRRMGVRIAQKPAADEPRTCSSAAEITDHGELRQALRDGTVDVVGGTTWVWAREDFFESVDVLFIDEAGQMALANALAASQGARNLVLLGDPQQLDQPVKGSHPPGADRSALAHLLDGKATMPPDLGLFLDRTWRLHPNLCAFTSEAFYDGKLEPEALAAARALDAPGLPVHGAPACAGLRFLPVAHGGNGKTSREEAAAIAGLVAGLLASGSTWSDEHGTRPLTLDDILIITPYNAQVRAIAEVVPGARVGTVDKFQGQEAPIAIYSMASSSADEAPRGMEFLYSLNRLNVATSRAQGLAIVVASPELLRARCQTPRQMQLANALCRLVELATGAA